MQILFQLAFGATGQIKWLSLWLSVSREPGLGQADSGLPEHLSRTLHPLLLQPCPPGPLTQDTEGRACSRRGPVGAPGPPLPPRLDVWRLPVGRRPPGPTLPVPAEPLTLAWPGGDVTHPSPCPGQALGLGLPASEPLLTPLLTGRPLG